MARFKKMVTAAQAKAHKKDQESVIKKAIPNIAFLTKKERDAAITKFLNRK
jgi:ferritin